MGESLVYALKVAIVVAATTAFVAAALSMFSLITAFTTNTAFGEIISLIGIYLPFNAGAFFGSLSAAITAILAFFVAKKVYQLTLNAQASA